MAGSQGAGPRLFLRASFRHCHYCPYYFFLLQDSLECHHQREECHAWLTLRRISNPTPCTGWQRCFKNNQNSLPKARYFITVWTWSCHVNPNAYLCFWVIQWRLLWFNHILSCILFLTFYMFKGVQKWNLSKILDALAMNQQKLLWTFNTELLWSHCGPWVIAQSRTKKSFFQGKCCSKANKKVSFRTIVTHKNKSYSPCWKSV